MHSPKRIALLSLSLVLASIGCRSEESGTAQFAVSVTKALSAESVVRVTVTSSGPDMPSIATELVKTNGVWGGVIGNIPAGSGREFHARAYDAGETLLFEGISSGVTITANQTTLVAITLQEVNPPPPFSNEVPIVQSVVAAPTTVQAGGFVSLQSTAYDPNAGDTLSYSWTATAGSFFDPTHPSTSWIAPNTTGLVTLILAVSDSQGASSSVSIVVNVVSGSGEGGALLDVRFNSWPVISVVSVSATPLEAGQSTVGTVTASDGDGDTLAYQWASTCAGAWTNPTSSTASFSPSETPSGACNNCQLTVTVSDGRGGQTTGTVALCVASTTTNRFPPTIVRSYQSSLTALPSQQLTFEVSASDPQNSSLTFSWSASTGTLGTPQYSASTSRVAWTAPACVNGSTPPTISTTVTNAHGLAATRTFGITGLPACATSGWALTGSMAAFRNDHTATLLPNGKVLVAGGLGIVNGSLGVVATAEVYDPVTGTWSATGSMAVPRELPTATLLPGGKVLVVGGYASNVLASAEVYDPTSGTWSVTGSMAVPRSGHTATLLPNGKVLVAAGQGISSTEVYDPDSGTWSVTGSLFVQRHMHTATLLPNGKVLVAGGYGSNALASAEVYDPASGTWSTSGSMADGRYLFTATLLPNGTVLVAGGIGSLGSTIGTAEAYNPTSGTWSAISPMSLTRFRHAATLLPNGKVLISGGYAPFGDTAAELYTP